MSSECMENMKEMDMRLNRERGKRIAKEISERAKGYKVKTQGSCSGHECCRRHGGKRTPSGKCDKGG